MKSLLILILSLVPCFSWSLSSSGYEALRLLPVQDGGRIKPLDTYATESLLLIFGKSTYENKNPVEIFMTWVLAPEEWKEKKMFLVRHNGLREGLRLENQRLFFSLNELLNNDRLGLAINSLRGKLSKEEKLDSYFQAVQKLANQIQRFHTIANGADVRVAPPKSGGNQWVAIKGLDGELLEKFTGLVSAFASELKLGPKDSSSELSSAVATYINTAKAIRGSDYAPFSRLKAELHYNKFKPFKWSWIFYLLAVFLVLLSMAFSAKALVYLSWLSVALGFVFHTYGIGLRVFISNRPPVSNMFETVVWVPWIAILCAAVAYRNKLVLMGASVVGALCLILCHLAPTILDASFSPLEPVLKDNFWLLTHVIIIVSSYGPYFLAFLLGDVALVYFLLGEKKHKAKIKDLTTIMYRCIQVGSVLLLAGTILGGVWADYSWGRFWGWDPKETWAFIAFMGYAAVLHARLVGWVRDFGMAMSSVVCFILVIMAWYGVNFVLGQGLHSYGNGSGGLNYVATFCGIHVLFLLYVALMRALGKQK